MAACSVAMTFLIASRSRSASAALWVCSFATMFLMRASALRGASAARGRLGARFAVGAALVGVAVVAGAVAAVGASMRESSVRAAFIDAAVMRTPYTCACAFASSVEILALCSRMFNAARIGGRTCRVGYAAIAAHRHGGAASWWRHGVSSGRPRSCHLCFRFRSDFAVRGSVIMHRSVPNCRPQLRPIDLSVDRRRHDRRVVHRVLHEPQVDAFERSSTARGAQGE